MKLTKITTAASALAFAAFLGTAAHAQTAGDVIISLQQVSTANDYEVDLGPASQFLNPTASTESIDLSELDLNAAFGNNWGTATGSNAVQWGLAGANTSNSANLTLGSSTLAPNTLLISWNPWAAAPIEKGSSTQKTAAGYINQLYNDVSTFGTPTTGSTVANPAVLTAESDPDSFAYDVASHTNFNLGAGENGPLDYNSDTTIPAADGLTLDLYELTPTNAPLSAGGPKATTLLGTFTLSTGGVLTFTEAPEPSTYLMMGIGGLVLLWRLRRNAFIA